MLQDVLQKVLAGASATGTTAKVLTQAGVVRPHHPVALARAAKALRDWGTGPAGGFTAAALLDPGRTAIIDELGSLTFDEVHRRSNALARAFAELGVSEGDSVALMCRNHRGFVDASIATAKLGADILYLNTAFAGPQLVDVLEREKPTLVVHDEELAERIGYLQNAIGGVAGPFDSWLVLRGLKTLALRMERHCDNAEAVVAFLQEHPGVSEVFYPGLASHPGHEVAARQMKRFGGIVSFRVAAGEQAAVDVGEADHVALHATPLEAAGELGELDRAAEEEQHRRRVRGQPRREVRGLGARGQRDPARAQAQRCRGVHDAVDAGTLAGAFDVHDAQLRDAHAGQPLQGPLQLHFTRGEQR